MSTATQKGLTAATLIGKAAFYAMTGQISKARAALRLLNMTAKMNPFGLILAAVTALTVAYFAFRRETGMIAELHREVAKSVAKERSELDSLLKVARNENISKAKRKEAIEKINKIAPEYLENINLENINTKETTKSIDKYIKALNRKALSQAAAAKKQELFAKRIDKENEILSSGSTNTSGFWEMFGIDSQDFKGIDDLNKYLDKNIESGKMSEATAKAIRDSYKEIIEVRKEDLAAIDAQIAALDKYIDVSGKPVSSDTESEEIVNPYSPIATPTGKSKKDKQKLYDLEKEHEEYMRVRRANTEAKSKLNEIEYKRELEQLEIQHKEKMAKLEADLVEEKELVELQSKADVARSNGDDKTADNFEQVIDIWRKKNEALKAQMHSEEQVHQLQIGRIIEDGQERQIDELQAKYNREKVIRETAFNDELNEVKSLAQAKSLLRKNLSEEELSSIKTLEQAKEELRKQYELKELDNQAQHLRELISQMEEMFNSGDFEGFELDMLPEEEKQEMLQRLEELKLALSLIAQEKAKITGSVNDDSLLGGDQQVSDLFGMTADDWDLMFDNLKKSENLISTVAQAAQVLTDTWKAYSDYKTAAENREYQNFENKIEGRKQRQQNLLDQTLINQRQHDRAVRELDKQKERKKAELEYKQAKRNKAIAITEAVISTSLAVMQAFAQLGPVAGGVAAAFIGTMGALQIATISKQPLPARGYEDGL